MMNKMVKRLLIAACFLVLIGIIMFSVVMTVYKWDFTKLNTVKSENKTYEVNEAFTKIKFDIIISDVLFEISEDSTCRVVRTEYDNMNNSVFVKDGVLTINESYGKKMNIQIAADSPKITVYLPKGEYESVVINGSSSNVTIQRDFKFKNADISLSSGDVDFSADVTDALSVKLSSGNISVKNNSFGTADVTVSSGKVNVSDVLCKNIFSNGSSGVVVLKNVNASESINISRSSGDVRIESSDAAEISVKTNSGDVTGSLLAGKTFITKTSSGSVNVPKTTGGKCEIETSSGDIAFEIINISGEN